MDHAKFMVSILNGICNQSRKDSIKLSFKKMFVNYMGGSILLYTVQVLTKHLFIVSDRGVKQSSPGRKEGKTDGQVKTDTTIFRFFFLLLFNPLCSGKPLNEFFCKQ